MTGSVAEEAESAAVPAAESIWCSAQLLVEGKDDLHLVRELIKARSLPPVQVRPYDGVNNFRRFLSALIATPGFETVTSLGVLRDADRNASAAFQSVQDALVANSIEPPRNVGTPEDHEAHGRPIRVGVLVLPVAGPGVLETVLCETFADQPVGACVENFVSCLVRSGIELRNKAKTRVHAYLSTRERPGSNTGVAASQGAWDLDHAALDSIADFVSAVGRRASDDGRS